MRQVRYFLWSPITKTLLRKGTSDLMRYSMGTGGMFSPPEVMMSSNKIRGGNVATWHTCTINIEICSIWIN